MVVVIGVGEFVVLVPRRSDLSAEFTIGMFGCVNIHVSDMAEDCANKNREVTRGKSLVCCMLGYISS